MFLESLSAGPDPNTMTCDAIVKGYNLNLQLSKSRASGTHRQNSLARVAELEPFFKGCGGTVTPGAPASVPPGAVSPADISKGPAQPGQMTVPGGGSGGGSGGLALDWKKLALMVGGGVALVFVLSMLKKRPGSPATASGPKPSMADVMGGARRLPRPRAKSRKRSRR